VMDVRGYVNSKRDWLTMNCQRFLLMELTAGGRKESQKDAVSRGSLMKLSCRVCASSRVFGDAHLGSRRYFGVEPLVIEGPVGLGVLRAARSERSLGPDLC